MLKQKTPLRPGSKGLSRATSMKRGTVQLASKKPMARGDAQLARQSKPIRKRSRTNADPRKATGEAELCRGQPCYIRLPGLFCSSDATVVPCHSNSSQHGKGMGIKAHDEYTVPGCSECHRELDQGKRFTREEKFEFWRLAYERWKPKRQQLMMEKSPIKVELG